jgi:hypothetical protein
LPLRAGAISLLHQSLVLEDSVFILGISIHAHKAIVCGKGDPKLSGKKHPVQGDSK